MAKLECVLQGDLIDWQNRIEDGILNGSFSATEIIFQLQTGQKKRLNDEY